MKSIFAITTAFAITFLSTTAIAEGHAEQEKPKSKPPLMMLMAKTSPMPVLMPVMVKNSEKLGLTKEQNDELARWRSEAMAPALTLANEIIEGDKAIKQAALDGKAQEEIAPMIKSVLEKRSEMANKMLQCREHSRKVLTEKQWDQVVALYGEMQDNHKNSHDHNHQK